MTETHSAYEIAAPAPIIAERPTPEVIAERMAQLTPRQYAAVQELRHAALWYAWGRADGMAPDAAGRNLVDAWQFAEEYAEHARRYAAEEIGYRPSIMDALRDHMARRAEQVTP